MNTQFRKHFLRVICVVCAMVPNAAPARVIGLSQLGGWVYIDRDNDGVLAFSTDPNPEFVIGDIQIDLFSKTGTVETFVATTQSDDFGRYLFEDISPGTYVLRESQSPMFVDGIDTIGILQSLNGQPIPGTAFAGTVANDVLSDIVLTADVGGEFYDFGERGLAPGYVSKRFLFASRPEPPSTTPPPTGTPAFPEPTSLTIALFAFFSVCLTFRHRRRG
jgi:SdrD B-like domain